MIDEKMIDEELFGVRAGIYTESDLRSVLLRNLHECLIDNMSLKSYMQDKYSELTALNELVTDAFCNLILYDYSKIQGIADVDVDIEKIRDEFDAVRGTIESVDLFRNMFTHILAGLPIILDALKSPVGSNGVLKRHATNYIFNILSYLHIVRYAFQESLI